MNNITPIEPPTGLPKGVKIAIAVIAIVIVCLVLFASCSTLQKLKTSESINVDSTTVKKTDSTHVKTFDSLKVSKDNTVTTKETDGDYTKETIIEFDTSSSTVIIKGTLPHWDIDAAADYFPAFTRPVKKITIKETGQVKTKERTEFNRVDSTSVKGKDSANVKTGDSTNLVKETKKKSKEVVRTNYTGLVIGCSLLLLLLILLYVYRKQIKQKFTFMKKLLPFLILLFSAAIVFTSCSPAYQGGGFIIPVGAALLAGWCGYRYFFNAETKGTLFPLICGLVMLALCVVYIIYANLTA